MDLEATFSAICKNCGGHCCRGAVGRQTEGGGMVWFFPRKIKSFFYPPDAPLKYRVGVLWFFITTVLRNGGITVCKWHKTGGCPQEERLGVCKDFYCHGIITQLEMRVGVA